MLAMQREQEERLRRAREEKEKHLYTVIKAARDEDLAKQIGSTVYWDLLDFEQVCHGIARLCSGSAVTCKGHVLAASKLRGIPCKRLSAMHVTVAGRLSTVLSRLLAPCSFTCHFTLAGRALPAKAGNAFQRLPAADSRVLGRPGRAAALVAVGLPRQRHPATDAAAVARGVQPAGGQHTAGQLHSAAPQPGSA